MTQAEPRSILTTLLLAVALAAVAPNAIAADESETAHGVNPPAYLGTSDAIAADESESDETTLEDVKQELADTGGAIKAYSADQRDEAVAEAESALATLDTRIEETQAWVDEHWDEMSQATRENARESMENLRAQRNQVAEWLGGLKHSSAEAWDAVKDGFSDAWVALEESWSQAQEEFDSEQ